MKRQKFLVRIAFYVAGMIILALGLALNAKTNLGIAPVASLPYTVSMILGMNYGNVIFVSYVIFVGAELLLVPKGGRALVLLQIPFSLLFTRLINGFETLLSFQSAGTALNVLLLLVAIVLIGLGAALTMSLKLVPNPVDGLVLALAEYLHTKIGLTKNVFDFSNALLALLLGLVVGTPFLGVGAGTILCALGVGRVFAIFNRYLKPWVQRQAGISEDSMVNPQKKSFRLDAQTAEAGEE